MFDRLSIGKKILCVDDLPQGALPKYNTKIDPAKPDDIRNLGWMVAVHNDYKLDGKFYTFWLFTFGERAIKGEGESDAVALNEIRKKSGLEV